jgi:hypothetical protein
MTRHLRPLAVLLLLAPLGCREPLPEAELRRRLATQGAERSAFRSVVSFYDLSLSGRRPNGRRGRLSCAGQIAAERDRGLRMRGVKALGMAKIFDFLVVGDGYKFYFIHGKKFYVGSVSKALAALRARALAGEGRPDLAALLFPVPPLEGKGAPRWVSGRRDVRLEWSAGSGGPRRRLIIDATNARPLRTEIFGEDGRRAAVIYYKKPAEAGEFHPVSGFKLRAAGRSRFRMDFSFNKMTINAPIRDAAFKLEAPAGIEVIDVDKRKKPVPEKK